MSKSLDDLTPQQLRKAAVLKEKIAELQSELDALLAGGGSTKKKPAGAKPKRNISPEGRARIAAAQKRRWATKKKAAAKAASAAKDAPAKKSTKK